MSAKNKIILILVVWSLVLIGGVILFTVPQADSTSVGKASSVQVDSHKILADSLRRKMQQSTLRVRNITCTGLGRGSAIAIDRRTLVTNHHVIDGAIDLQVNTWDGKTIEAKVESVSKLSDIALVKINKKLPVSRKLSSRWKENQKIYIAGYPNAEELEITTGNILGKYPEHDHWLTVKGNIQPGNSGGPVFNSRGKVIGIVVARSTANDEIGFIIPAQEIRETFKASNQAEIQACQYSYQ